MSTEYNTPILIIGNGGAAAQAVRALREAGYDGGIDMAADVAGPPFNPMLLPYLLKEAIAPDVCAPFGSEFHDAYGVTCRFGSGVTKLDAKAKTADLANGDRIRYDQCLIATGAKCIIPPLPGLAGAERALTFRTSGCGDRMFEAVAKAKTAVVLGASLVGAKLAEVLTLRGLEVTLVDLADRLIPGAAHPESSRTMQTLLEKSGIRVLLSHRLSGAISTDNDIRLHFEGTGEIVADFACVCTGVRPAIDFIDPEQVPIGNAILVDESSRTGAEGLFAAGDVAEGYNLLTGRHQWFGLWGKAKYQGRAAGYAMAGKECPYAGTLPEYITPLAGRVFAGLGDVNLAGPEAETHVYRNEDGLTDAVLTFDKGVLAGFNLVGDLSPLDRLKTALIRRLDLSGVLKLDQPRLPEILSTITDKIRGGAGILAVR